MTVATKLEPFGRLIEPTTLQIQRLLPGPIERVWDYLVKSDLRRQWLAAGEMEPSVGTSFELVWRNSEISDPPGERPANFPQEHRMKAEVTVFDPPRTLAFTWGSTGGVTFNLEPEGDGVLLTLTHRRVEDHAVLLNVSAGWHAHLDVLVLRMNGKTASSFWETWSALKAEYTRRLPA